MTRLLSVQFSAFTHQKVTYRKVHGLAILVLQIKLDWSAYSSVSGFCNQKHW